MRMLCTVLAMLLMLNAGCIDDKPDPRTTEVRLEPLSCAIHGKPTYELGSYPDITVSIMNQTDTDIYLVGNLDKSYGKWRYPYCYFEVIGPDGKSAVENRVGCLNTSELREKDFIKVPPGGSFDPFQEIDEYGFFSASQQLNPETFRKSGEYRIRFVYSSRSEHIGVWHGDAMNEKLVNLFHRVPKVEVRRNEMKVTIVERGK